MDEREARHIERDPLYQKFCKCITKDAQGNPHFNVPAMLRVMEIADTPANRQIMVHLMLEVFAEQTPGAQVAIDPELLNQNTGKDSHDRN